VNVIALCRVVRALPDGWQPADQLQAAATSAAANYRASGRARSRAEFVSKLGIVREEMDEAVYWLEILKRSQMGNLATVDPLLRESKELRAIFASSYRTARRGRRG
jgi:four helix bundle protein